MSNVSSKLQLLLLLLLLPAATCCYLLLPAGTTQRCSEVRRISSTTS